MASTPNAGPVNLGFLMVLQEGNTYLGGYLVTNQWGRPLGFHLSSAVQPNKVQQVLYAATLVPYVCADLIGKALVDKALVDSRAVINRVAGSTAARIGVERRIVAVPLSSNCSVRRRATSRSTRPSARG